MLARPFAALVVTVAAAFAGCSGTSNARSPGPCGLVDEGVVPAEAVAADLLAGSKGNKALRDVWAARHGLRPGFAYFEPEALGEGWAVHSLTFEDDKGGRGVAVGFVHAPASGPARWWSIVTGLGADRRVDDNDGSPRLGVVDANDGIVPGGPSEAVLRISGLRVRKAPSGDEAEVVFATADQYWDVASGAPVPVAFVVMQRFTWDKALVGGALPSISTSELYDPPGARCEATSVGYGNGRISVRAMTDVPPSQPDGDWEVGKVPTVCAPASLAP